MSPFSAFIESLKSAVQHGIAPTTKECVVKRIHTWDNEQCLLEAAMVQAIRRVCIPKAKLDDVDFDFPERAETLLALDLLKERYEEVGPKTFMWEHEIFPHLCKAFPSLFPSPGQSDIGISVCTSKWDTEKHEWLLEVVSGGSIVCKARMGLDNLPRIVSDTSYIVEEDLQVIAFEVSRMSGTDFQSTLIQLRHQAQKAQK